MYKVNDRNTSARCEIYSKATIKTSKHLNLTLFLYSNVSTKNVKRQCFNSPLTLYILKYPENIKRKNGLINNCPKFLRKLNNLKNAFKISRYRHTLSHH